MQRLLLSIFSLFFIVNLWGQELLCNVTVNSSRIEGTNKDVFTTLQDALSDFLNNTVFTNQVYGATERIECNVLLDVTDYSSNEFSGKLQIQSRRPVYGSSYNSTTLNYVDNDIKFTYQEFDPIQLSENTYISNLSSIFSFYAYILIGLDNDTFSLYSGDAFYQIAEKILNAAQSSGYTGWQASDDKKRKNRYWLVDNLLNNEYKPLRKFYYNYHLKGLDVMENSADNGRSGVTDAIADLESFSNNKPDPFTYLFQIFLETKSDEFVQIYSEAPQTERVQMQKKLTAIDPASSSKYKELSQ